MKNCLSLIVLLHVIALQQCQKQCDPSYCNHEGQCSIEANDKTCKCIGSQYYQGSQCIEKVNHCNPNPCVNGGQCHSLVGQFICSNCNEGYGGLRCDVGMPKLFRNLVVMFNHYGSYAKRHKFLLLLEDLGSVPFSVEFVAENYVIDSFENSGDKNESLWMHSFDLFEILRKHNIRHDNDLPFRKGFYRLAQQTFWDVDLLTLTLRAYDAESASELLYHQTFDLFIENKRSLKCIHKLKFPHGSDPTEPLKVDIARFNNFKFLLQHRCQVNSNIQYEWSIYDSSGERKLHNFGVTQQPLLKISPYRLWFGHHGSVMSSYSLVVRLYEKWQGLTAITEGRCFIFVEPKPVQPIIKGGLTREHGVGQPLLLDGSESRDFALAPKAKQTLSYYWTCYSEDDPENTACKNLQSTRNQLYIPAQRLKANATYQFSLRIQSKVNLFSNAVVKQTILVEKQSKIFVNIECLRNCMRNQFNSGRSIHLKVECIPKTECVSNSNYLWSVDGTIQGTEQHLIYMPDDGGATSISVLALVWHSKLEGKSSLDLSKNVSPTGGQCTVEPQDGIAFHNEFHIQCQDFQVIDLPLTYHYAADDFLLESTNDPYVHFGLPACSAIKVQVCDAFDSCTEIILPVTVRPLEKPESLKYILNQNQTNINELLECGNRLGAIVLVKSLTPHISTADQLKELLNAMQNLKILTLEELKQSLNIGLNIIQNILPLDNEKSIAMFDFLKKLHHGLISIQKDKEIQDISLESFEKCLQTLGLMLGEFSNTWETLPEVEVQPQLTSLSSDPIAEFYKELPDLDTSVLEHVANWLESSRVLHQCFEILSSHSIHLYFPKENGTIMEEDKFIIQFKAMENIKSYTWRLENQTVDIEFSKDENYKFLENAIILQMVSFNANPFWWYPNDQPLSINTFAINAFSRNTENLKNSLTFKIPPLDVESLSIDEEIPVTIHNTYHMPIFVIKVPPHAAVAAALTKTEVSLFLEISIGQRPQSFHMQKSKRQNSTIVINNAIRTRTAYIAVLAGEDIQSFPLHLTLHINIIECLYWNWLAKDPQWSTAGCRPKAGGNSLLNLTCKCLHLSTFAAKNYASQPYEDLRDNPLLSSLPINWKLVMLYVTLLLVFIALIAYNTYRWKSSNDILLTSAGDDYLDMEVQIYTGSPSYSGTTANIHMTFISTKGPYTIVIYQNPGRPQLVRNSQCKLRVSSNSIGTPYKLKIRHDGAGRYPSWFCHKINVVNIPTDQSQMFSINKWISEKPVEFFASNQKPTFREILLSHYINWYQFQAILGPCSYTDLCCIQRCHVWVAQTMVSVCIVACYYGPTTMATYENERDKYRFLQTSIKEALVLSLVCVITSCIIKIIFSLLCNHRLPQKKPLSF